MWNLRVRPRHVNRAIETVRRHREALPAGDPRHARAIEVTHVAVARKLPMVANGWWPDTHHPVILLLTPDAFLAVDLDHHDASAFRATRLVVGAVAADCGRDRARIGRLGRPITDTLEFELILDDAELRQRKAHQDGDTDLRVWLKAHPTWDAATRSFVAALHSV